MKRVASGLAAVVLAFPGVSSAQAPAAPAEGGGVAIDHKAVSCIVAEKFPKLNACFTPNSSVAKARVYFRAEGGTSWYYVDMKSDAPCMSGILPKPRKEMIDKHVDYYVHATDKAFTEARTLEYNPLVVSSESACKDKPIAAALSKASIQVFPSLPAGFAAGGVGAGVVVGGAVVAGAAAGGIYAATKSSNDTTTTTPIAGVTTTLGTTTTTTTTTTTITTPVAPAFRFSFQLSPLKGTEPVTVKVDMCGSTPSGASLKYFYDFDGDGVDDFFGPGFCSETATYNLKSVTFVAPFGLAPTPTPAPTTLPAPKTWTVRGCAQPRDPDIVPQDKVCQTGTVTVEPLAPTTTLSPVSTIGTSAGFVRKLSWSSQLDVASASGQVVLNNTAAAFSAAGRSSGVAEGRSGTNRVEAQLVEGAGKPGTWRFDFGATQAFKVGSLRVVAGEAAAVTGDAVTFRLKGTPGERVVFTFETDH